MSDIAKRWAESLDYDEGPLASSVADAIDGAIREATMDLANRLAAASSVLGRLAEKGGAVGEAMKYRMVLQRLACRDEPYARKESREALGWE